MARRMKVPISVLVALAIGLMTVGCRVTPTRRVSPKAISRDDAIKMVVEKVAKPSEAPKGLRVHAYPDLLAKGSIVEPYITWLARKKQLPSREDIFVCKTASWFFWFDEDPLADFAHKTRFVFVDASTGKTTIQESQWWPVVNKKMMWNTSGDRASRTTLVFEKLVEKLKMGTDLPRKPGPVPHPSEATPGCEAWAIIICGEGDTGMSFDENVHGMYDVFKGLGYADDHIFYVSPWTADPGVDRITSVMNIEWAIDQVELASDNDDMVFFYHTSHGGIDELVINPDPTSFADDDIVTANELDTWLDDITSRRLVVILQACHSGSFIGAYSDGTVVASENDLTGDGETNRIVITSTDTDYSSYPDNDGAGDPNPADVGSEFSSGYIEAFSAAAADTDSDGTISVDEAYAYACANDYKRILGWEFPQRESTSLDPKDVFHSCPSVDVWISDGPSDIGNNSFDYDSTDIWSSLSSTGTSHENPVSGLTNYVHVRTHNLGSTPATSVDVKLYWANTSTALAWPTDFHQIGMTFTIAAIPAGGNVEHTWSWYVDPAIGVGHSFCFVATGENTADPVTGGPPGCTYVAPFDNNIGQKNVTIVPAQAGQTAQATFFIENNNKEMVPFDLVVKGTGLPKGRTIITLPDDLTKILKENKKLLSGVKFVDRGPRQVPGLLITAKEQAVIRQIRLKPLERRLVSIDITAPKEAKVGGEFQVRIEQVADKQVVGANTFLVRIVAPADCRSTLRQTAQLYAVIAQKYKSERAMKLVKMIGEGLLNDICRDRKATLSFLRDIYLLEVQIGEELQKQPLPADLLKTYLEAIKAIGAALDAQDIVKAMIAQGRVVGVATKLVTHEQ